MEYKELKRGITSHLNSAAEDFFMVGYFLRQISENALFVEDGYKSIWEFAKGEYGLSNSSASRFMAINARFSIDGGEHMAEKYIGMGVSKLQEMLGLPDEELEKVTQETTVREIRAMKKKLEEPLSFFGLPKTVRPEGSLITTPGCGDGKYDCFTCCRECGIRQEERYCRTATMGNPFPCSQLNNEGWKQRIQFSLYKDECQLLHPELAPIREGDGEPNPCCLTCEHKTCFNRCDVAKKRDEDDRKKAQQELRKQQQEAEAKKPEPSERDIKAFYDYAGIKPTDAITADALKKRYKNAGGSGGTILKDFYGSQRGMRLNYKREITWAQLTKRIKEIQEKELAKEREKEDAVSRLRAQEEKEPVIIDADFREVEAEPEEAQVEEEEILCTTCQHEGECAGKKTHDSGCMGYEETGKEETELETAEEIQEPEIVEAELDPEQYTRRQVRDYLETYEKELEIYKKEQMPENTIRKLRILLDALTLLDKKMEAEEAMEDD